MGLRGSACASGQDELLQARQLGCCVPARASSSCSTAAFLQQRKARNRQLAPQVEQLVLHVDEQLAHAAGQGFAQQQTDV
jgi:hypothetical protein